MGSLHDQFYRVKLSNQTQDCLDLWNQCKAEALDDASGKLVGLAKIALQIWDEARDAGVKCAADRGTREAFATSFASASIVDDALMDMAKLGQISVEEYQSLTRINAEAAMHDLKQLTKVAVSAADLLSKLKAHPRAVGAGVGAGVGAALGAWKDDDNRLRGAALGAIPGAAVGALAGHGVDESVLAPLRKKHETAVAGLHGFGDVLHDVANKYREGHDWVQHLQDAGALEGNQPLTTVLQNQGLRDEIAEQSAMGSKAIHPDLLDTFPTQDPVDAIKRWLRAANTLAGRGPKTANFAPEQGPVPGQAGPPTPSPGSAPGSEVGSAVDPGPGGHPMGSEPLGQSPEEAAQQQMQQEAEQQAKEMATHNATVDNLQFLAEQVGLPSMAQEIAATREELIQHFAAGNQYLPHSLQKFFPQSQHAEQFIQKYKQRFAPLSTGAKAGSKKTAGDIFYASMIRSRYGFRS